MNSAEIEAYVCQSQLIEGISYTKSPQLTNDHIAATEYVLRCVEEGVMPDVRIVHRMLAASFLFCAGSFRTVPVYVARHDGKEKVSMPSAQFVPNLMEWWGDVFRQTIKSAELDHNKEGSCVALYYLFLCIHPFEDGNGRVGRLMYNAARLLCGLPWYTITVDIHPALVQELRVFERESFKLHFAECYEKEENLPDT